MLLERLSFPQVQYVHSEAVFTKTLCMKHAYTFQFRSLQLLTVSGIGLKETLEGFKIPVLADLAGAGQDTWVKWRYHI